MRPAVVAVAAEQLSAVGELPEDSEVTRTVRRSTSARAKAEGVG
jgi:hypothetical protein